MFTTAGKIIGDRPLRNRMDPDCRARSIFLRYGGALRTKDALRLGIHPETLYRMRNSGELTNLGRSLYRLSDLPPPGNPDLVTVTMKIPNDVICLIPHWPFMNSRPRSRTRYISLCPTEGEKVCSASARFGICLRFAVSVRFWPSRQLCPKVTAECPSRTTAATSGVRTRDRMPARQFEWAYLVDYAARLATLRLHFPVEPHCPCCCPACFAQPSSWTCGNLSEIISVRIPTTAPEWSAGNRNQ